MHDFQVHKNEQLKINISDKILAREKAAWSKTFKQHHLKICLMSGYQRPRWVFKFTQSNQSIPLHIRPLDPWLSKEEILMALAILNGHKGSYVSSLVQEPKGHIFLPYSSYTSFNQRSWSTCVCINKNYRIFGGRWMQLLMQINYMWAEFVMGQICHGLSLLLA